MSARLPRTPSRLLLQPDDAPPSLPVSPAVAIGAASPASQSSFNEPLDAASLNSSRSLSPSSLSQYGPMLPLSPLSRDISLPVASDMVHSFSQPELYRLAHPHTPAPADGSAEGEAGYGDAYRVYDHAEHSHDERMYDPVEGGSDDSAPQPRMQLEAHEGQLSFEPPHSPTIAQHAATHQTWIAEAREEAREQREAVAAAAAAAAAEEEGQRVRSDQADAEVCDTLDEASSLLSPTDATGTKRSKQRRPASPTAATGNTDDTASSDGSVDDLPELTRWQLVGLCLPAAAVMVGWAVGEALLMPYLLSLGVHPTVANFAFLINPIFGLFLQPLFGRLSDQCTWSWGRRRPFLLLFCMGSATGLTIVVWSKQIADALIGSEHHSLADEKQGVVHGRASILQIVLVFVGFAVMDLCHDLLLMPARALLNDRLPDEQTDQGNSFFACISSLGSCLGLALTIIPLESIPPWSWLVLPIRATFTTATVIILACNLTTLFISNGLDQPFEGDSEDIADEDDETSALLGGTTDRPSYGSAAPASDSMVGAVAADSPSPSPPDVEAARSELHRAKTMPLSGSQAKGEAAALASSNEQPSTSCWCFAENPFTGISDAYWILPRPLKFIWLLQLVWWYCALHVNLWWTSWMAVELFGGPDPEAASAHKSKDDPAAIDPAVAIRLATIGLLVQAVVSFPASAALPWLNRHFGITNTYHASAILYGLAVLAIGFVNTYTETIVIQIVCGLAVPPIFSSSYILVEVYASEADEEDSDSDDDSETEFEGDEDGSATPQAEGQVSARRPALGRFGKRFEESAGGEGGSARHSPMLLPSSSPPPAAGGGSNTPKRGSRRPSTSKARDSTDSPRLGPASSRASPSPSPRLEGLSIPRSSGGGVGVDRPPSAAPSSEKLPSTTSPDDPSSASSDDFTTATLESKRGTITALFNITMIIAQTLVGLGSGVLIDLVGNITIVFYVSGFLLVTSNLFVLSLRLSKPPTPLDEEEELPAVEGVPEPRSIAEERAEDKLREKARETTLRIQKLEFAAPPQAVAHPPVSPPLEVYQRAFEAVPHVAPGTGANVQYVRPLGSEEAHHLHPHAHHVHLHPSAPPPLLQHRGSLKRSLSAPDVRLAKRFLRKRHAAKAAVAAAPKEAGVRVALFQPHGMTLGMRRHLLRGGRPKIGIGRNTRVDVDQLSDAGRASLEQQQSAAETRAQMRVDHHARMEARALEQVRERARLFGLKVATRALQIKASRAHKNKRTAAGKGGAHTAGGDGLPQLQPQAMTRDTARRNNQAPRSSAESAASSSPGVGLSKGGLRRPSSRHPPPHSATAASSRAFASSSSLPAAHAAAAASLVDDCKLPPAAPAAAASSSSSTSRSLADGSCVGLDYSSSGHMTWSLLSDRDGRASSSSCFTPSGAVCPQSFGVSSDLCGVVDASVPLPAPGSTQENELIQRLAEAAVEREQKQQDREQGWRRQQQRDAHDHALTDSADESTSDATSLPRPRPTSVDELRFPERASADDRNGVTSPTANAEPHNK